MSARFDHALRELQARPPARDLRSAEQEVRSLPRTKISCIPGYVPDIGYIGRYIPSSQVSTTEIMSSFDGHLSSILS